MPNSRFNDSHNDASSGDEPNQLFEDADEETLALLLSPHTPSVEVKSHLTQLVERFEDDANPEQIESFWKQLGDTLASHHMSVSLQKHNNNNKRDPLDVSRLPPAFETASGKKHLKATCALLRISEPRAARLTMSALRSYSTLSTQESHLSSLLGTRHLFHMVLNYHFPQRLARLQVVAELLRIFQDDTSPYQDVAEATLDPLDQHTTLHQRQRGLFCRLLATACAPWEPPTRLELASLLELRGSHNKELSAAAVADVLEATRLQTLREREQAMEALLVLCYGRMEGGIHRVDYAALLVAFSAFRQELPENRLTSLAGLICAEATSLWHVLAAGEEAQNWADRHPLLEGLPLERQQDASSLRVGTSGPAQELEALGRLLRESGAAATHPAPEAIALLSFGLLLVSIPQGQQEEEGTNGTPYVQKLHTMGLECLAKANDEGDAFVQLQMALAELLPDDDDDPSRRPTLEMPYDWQELTKTPLLTDDANTLSSQPNNSNANLAYASIGLEVLSCTIKAFSKTIRRGNNVSMENLTALVDLTSVIYGNRPTLCERYWSDLRSLTDTTSEMEISTPNHAICFLMDAAHVCANAALHRAMGLGPAAPRVVEQEVLQSLAPLLRLVSSLCSNSEELLSVLDMLPAGTIRVALLACSPSGPVTDPAVFQRQVRHVLESIRTFATVDSSCSTALLTTLEEPGSHIIDGPRVLFRILSHHEDPAIVETSLFLFGCFLRQGSTHVPRAVTAVKYLASSRGQGGLPSYLTTLNDKVNYAGVQALNGLVDSLSSIVFSDCEEQNALAAMEAVLNGCIAACSALTSSLSKSSTQDADQLSLSCRVAHGVLEALGKLLSSLRPICLLHASPKIRSSALEMRNSVIHAISSSSGFGNALAYYCCAPVSLSLGVALLEKFRGTDVLNRAAEEHAREGSSIDFGAWRNLVQHSHASKSSVSATEMVQSVLADLFGNKEMSMVDLEAVSAQGWTRDGDASLYLETAGAALEVVRLWALHAEDIVVEKHNIVGSNLTSEAASDLGEISPCRLISSTAVIPPPIGQHNALVSIWPAGSLSVLHLLMQYLRKPESDETDQRFPVLRRVTLDAMSLILVHGRKVEDFHPQGGSMVSLVEKCVPLLGNAMGESIQNIADSMHLQQGLSMLRLLRSLLLLNAKQAVEVISASKNRVALTASVHRVVSAMLSEGRDVYCEQLDQDETLTMELRIAVASLDVLACLWNTSSTDVNAAVIDKLRVSFRNESELVGDAIKLVSSYADISKMPHILGQTASSHHISTLLQRAVSSALTLLASEHSLEASDRMKALLKLPSQQFTILDGAAIMGKAISDLTDLLKPAKRAQVDGPSSLLWSFPISLPSRFERSDSELCDVCDAAKASTWLLSLQGIGNSAETAQNLDAAYALLSGQITLIFSWTFFLQTCMVGDQSSDISEPLSQDISRDLLCVGTMVEKCQMVLGDNFLALESGRIGDVLSALLVQIQDSRRAPLECKSAIDMLEQLNTTCEKYHAVSRPVSHGKSRYAAVIMRTSGIAFPLDQIQENLLMVSCRTQQLMLISAVQTISNIGDDALTMLPRRLDDALIGLASIACKNFGLVELLETYGKDRPQYVQMSRDLLQTSVALLSVLVSTRSVSKRTIPQQAVYLSSFALCLRTNDAINSMVRFSHISSARAVRQKTGTVQPADEEEVKIVHAIFSFLSVISEISAHSPELGSLLSEDSVSQLLLNNPLLMRASYQWSLKDPAKEPTQQLRGYLPSQQNVDVKAQGSSPTKAAGSYLSGRNDPVHGVWRASLELLRSLVQSRRHVGDRTNQVDAQFFGVACDFLTAHHSALLECLKSCCSFAVGSTASTFSSQQESKALTLNVLREASDILSLVSLMCSPIHGNKFEEDCPTLFGDFSNAVRAVVFSLSKFLGATGAARELFAALLDFENAVEGIGAQGNDELALEAFSPVLAGGIPNASHEAIRNAHTARRCCAFVTAEDYASLNASSSPRSDAPRQTSSLERDCRACVESRFLIRMEHAAGTCVSFALSILWETHPASSCFLMLSKDEVARFDSLSNVKPGMVIAIRPGATDAASPDVEFASVLQVDTVRRVFHVQYFGESRNTEGNIGADRLAGVEDVTKRRAVLAYSAAPDSASELEAAVSRGPSPSTGDLLLALRWCHQYQGRTVDAYEPGAKATRRRLADLASVLLGTEISLHRESRTPLESANSPTTKRIKQQLLTLFGDEEAPNRGGYLKSVLSDKVWTKLQEQLGSELNDAQSERDSIVGKTSEASGGTWVSSSHPRSNRRTSFRTAW